MNTIPIKLRYMSLSLSLSLSLSDFGTFNLVEQINLIWKLWHKDRSLTHCSDLSVFSLNFYIDFMSILGFLYHMIKVCFSTEKGKWVTFSHLGNHCHWLPLWHAESLQTSVQTLNVFFICATLLHYYVCTLVFTLCCFTLTIRQYLLSL